MRRHYLSRAAYRLLLRAYPGEFRDRFGSDLQADFGRLLRQHGTVRAWTLVVADLARSVPLTTSDAVAAGERTARVAGPFLPRGESIMRSLPFDLRHAVRGLLHAPAFTAVTIVTLTLAIGANTATFSLVNAALLRPLGYAEPERLMAVFETIPESGVERFEVSPADYLDLVRYQQSFSALAAYRSTFAELSGAGEPEQVSLAEVSPALFEVLGVGAARGRVFAAGDVDDEAGVAVISHRLAERRFGGAGAIGRRLVLDRRAVTVIGVMPAPFEFPRRGPVANNEPADVWVPLVFNPFERQARGMMYNNSVIARLRPEVTPAQAAADTAALARRIQDNYPASLRHAFTLTIGTAPLMDHIAGHARRPLLILLAAVALVLLVACANLTALLLSRSVARQRDIGVRAALGAGRLRLFQILLLEGLLLAGCGGVLGVAFGYWIVRTLPRAVALTVPGSTGIPLDWRVGLFAAAVALGCALVFALVPMAAGLRRNLYDLLREGRTTDGRSELRTQHLMIVASVAMAFVLLTAAGLLMQSFMHLVASDRAPAAANVLTMEVRLPVAGYRDAAPIRAFYQALPDRLRAIPGVQAVSLSSDLPLDPDGERRVCTPEGATTAAEQMAAAVTWVHGDLFGAYGIPIVRGRPFSSDEQRLDRRAAVVNSRLAERYWPGKNPIGKRFKWGLADSTNPWHEVVGVSADVADGPPGSQPWPHVYVPYAELRDAELGSPIARQLRRFFIGIRAERDPQALAGIVRGAVAALDPALATSRVATFTELQRNRLAPQRFSALVVGSFAAGALLLAAIGLYGTLAFTVSQRRREIGVRVALGAQRRDVVGQIVRRGMAMVAIGLVAGAAAALAATRLLRTLLFETSAHDPRVFVAVPVGLGLVALLACYLPARRAATVDPLIAMRID